MPNPVHFFCDGFEILADDGADSVECGVGLVWLVHGFGLVWLTVSEGIITHTSKWR